MDLRFKQMTNFERIIFLISFFETLDQYVSEMLQTYIFLSQRKEIYKNSK